MRSTITAAIGISLNIYVYTIYLTAYIAIICLKTEEIWIFGERVSIPSFQREHAQGLHASPFYRWLTDVENSRTWLAD